MKQSRNNQIKAIKENKTTKIQETNLFTNSPTLESPLTIDAATQRMLKDIINTAIKDALNNFRRKKEFQRSQESVGLEGSVESQRASGTAEDKSAKQ